MASTPSNAGWNNLWLRLCEDTLDTLLRRVPRDLECHELLPGDEPNIVNGAKRPPPKPGAWAVWQALPVGDSPPNQPLQM
jgi:hypothetical protein